jgi:hypothetical protein
MSLLRPFTQARAVLGVSDADDAAAVKRAYRRLALAHPPDTDPEGFRRVRAAYELLTEPSTRVREMLLQRHPAVDPPPPPAAAEAAPPAALPVVLLRLAAARVDAAALLESAASTSTNGPAPTPDETPDEEPTP